MTRIDRILLAIAAAGMPIYMAATALLDDRGIGEASVTAPPPPPGIRPPPAASAQAAVAPAAPETVKALRARGAKVTALGRHGSLEGWLVEWGPDDSYTLYTSPAGFAVAGLLYGPDGSNLTKRRLVERGHIQAGELWPRLPPPLRPPEDPAPAKPAGEYPDILLQAESATGFTVGTTGPHATLFADPACPWSRSAAAALADRALKGDLRLRIIPIGVLGERSRQRAVSILAHPRLDLAWFGGETAAPTAAAQAALAFNNAAFDAWGENLVPLIVWRSADGGIRRRTGEIADIDAWLAELAK